MRLITVRWCLSAVALIAIVVCGRAGLLSAVRASGAGQDRNTAHSY